MLGICRKKKTKCCKKSWIKTLSKKERILPQIMKVLQGEMVLFLCMSKPKQQFFFKKVIKHIEPPLFLVRWGSTCKTFNFCCGVRCGLVSTCMSQVRNTELFACNDLVFFQSNCLRKKWHKLESGSQSVYYLILFLLIPAKHNRPSECCDLNILKSKCKEMAKKES